MFSEKLTSPVTYQEKLQRQIWPDSNDTEAPNKWYYTLEAARKLAGPGFRSEDQTDPTERETEMSREEIDLLIRCYMASNIIKGMPQNVELTKRQVREHIVQESTHIYFDEEFNTSFDFKVIGKMIDDYLNNTSLKSINALYHKYRVEMLVDKKVEGKAEVEAEHGILGLSTEQAIKMIQKEDLQHYEKVCRNIKPKRPL